MEVWMQQICGDTPEQKKEQSRAGYCLLAEMAKNMYGYDLKEENNPVVRTTTGKPYLRLHRELFFNISHSGNWIVCVLGSVPAGIDIQYHRKIAIEKTAERICNPEEWKLFMKMRTEEEKEKLLFDIWTKKESYLKYTGEGIRRDLREVFYKDCRFYRLKVPEGYSATLCVECV